VSFNQRDGDLLAHVDSIAISLTVPHYGGLERALRLFIDLSTGVAAWFRPRRTHL